MMKKIFFRKLSDPSNGMKKIAICQRTEDKECKTRVKKHFVYVVAPSETEHPVTNAPQIYITKSFDTKRKIERFDFQVKGYFYMTHKRALLRVNFHQSLNIQIIWKTKDFSPKKSAILAE